MTAGAAYCRDCRLTLRRRGGSFGRVFHPDTCNENPNVSGPESCKRPPPKLEDPYARLYWRMFNAAGYGGVSFKGMDGDPAGHRLSEVRHSAEALGIPWDGMALMAFEAVEAIWREGVDDRLAARQEARDRRKKSPPAGMKKHFGAK